MQVHVYCKFKNYCNVFIIANATGYNRNNLNLHFEIYGLIGIFLLIAKIKIAYWSKQTKSQ